MSFDKDTSTTNWWWIRHAPVTSYEGRLYGNSDVIADTSDFQAFQGLEKQLPVKASWVTSHLKRTHQTADAIVDAGYPNVERTIEEDFGEQCFGDWQGLLYQEVEVAKAGKNHPFWIAPADYVVPNGESFADVTARVGAAITRLNKKYRGKDIISVAHGGTIRAALCHALGLLPAQALYFTIDNLSITRINCYHGPGDEVDWCVIGVNLPPSIGISNGVVFPPRR